MTVGLRDLFSKEAPPPAAQVAAAVDRFVPAEAEAAALKAELAAQLRAYTDAVLAAADRAESARLADVADARDKDLRRLESARTPALGRYVGYVLDLLVAAVWAACTVYLLLRALKLVDAGGADLTGVLALYSTVTATFMTCLTFHRGSSAGSRDKDALLRALQEGGARG